MIEIQTPFQYFIMYLIIIIIIKILHFNGS